jgi:hypothetical protein
VATFRYQADGDVSPTRFIAALTDFSERRLEVWPNLDAAYYRLHERGDTWAVVTEVTYVLGGIWARERYDWTAAGHVQLTLVASPYFKPGTTIEYRVTPRPGGGCHVEVAFQRIAVSLRARIIGAILTVVGPRRFARDLRTTLARLAALPA